MTYASLSPVKPHRLSLSTQPKLFSYSQNVVFTLSALLVFALFMYIGSDDEMLVRAQNSFRLRQLRRAVGGQYPDAPEATSTPTSVSLLISESNNTGLSAGASPELNKIEVQAPNSSRGVSSTPEPSVNVEGTPASESSRDALASEFSQVEVAPPTPSKSQVDQYVEVIPPVRNASTADQHCDGRRIYMYKLPAEFNELIGKECKNWTFEFWAMCDDIFNNGRGLQLNLSGDAEASRLLQPPSAWYKTDQFSLEVLFHHRIKTYPCLTEDPTQASMFYAPFYHTLDLTRNLFNKNLAFRDQLADRFIAWLRTQRAWQLTRGKRHLVVLGRIMWDFSRQAPSTWGSSLLVHPELKNATKVLIERILWQNDAVAIPYPTNFHPSSDAELRSWQATVRSANRTQFASFAGSSRGRNMTTMVRGKLFRQCADSPKCKQLRCTQKICGDNVQTIYKLALESVFCLQPSGDSPTRKGIFDTLLAGCIPVLFSPNQGVNQYMWHLKGNGSHYSVLMDGDPVRFNNYDVIAHLERIPKAEIARLQENIVQLLPSLLYRNPTVVGEYTAKDAFDITIDSALDRFNREDGGGGPTGIGSTSRSRRLR